MAFMVLAMSQIVQAYNMRSEHSLFKLGIFSNKQLNKAALASVVLTALVVFVPPIAKVFELIALPWYMYLIALGLILVPFVVMEISKALGLIKHRSHHTAK
jgi:Ca2+-transporting ATPase